MIIPSWEQGDYYENEPIDNDITGEDIDEVYDQMRDEMMFGEPTKEEILGNKYGFNGDI